MADNYATQDQPVPNRTITDFSESAQCAAAATMRIAAANAVAAGDTNSVVVTTGLLVADDLVARAQVGFDRYGTYLGADNGRDALVDAYQELLDAYVYIEQRMQEIKKLVDDTPKGVVEAPSKDLARAAFETRVIYDMAAGVGAALNSLRGLLEVRSDLDGSDQLRIERH